MTAQFSVESEPGPSGAPQTDVNKQCLLWWLQREPRAAPSPSPLQTVPPGKGKDRAVLPLMTDLFFFFFLLFPSYPAFTLVPLIPLMPTNVVYLLAT